MKNFFSFDDCISVLNTINMGIQEKEIVLCELDSVIGDGDHGTTLSRGFKAGLKVVNLEQPTNIEELFNLMGKTMISSMGGVSGPLFGSLFSAMGDACKNRDTLYIEDVLSMFEAGASKIMILGKAERGHKTLLDSLLPGIDSLKASTASGTNLHTAMLKMTEAAEAGVESTKNMVAKSGRARYAGDRALGRADAGATSMVIIIRAFTQLAEK